jgi:hypothetical protein
MPDMQEFIWTPYGEFTPPAWLLQMDDDPALGRVAVNLWLDRVVLPRAAVARFTGEIDPDMFANEPRPF